MNLELIHSRIKSSDLNSCSPAMRTEILLDTTPVPMFGNFRDATIVTIGINPSSNEFPSAIKDRRLVHLSDIGLKPDFFRRGDGHMTLDQVNSIEEGLLNYFNTKNTYWNWFGHAEDSLNIGFEASYMSAHKTKVVCHVDVFPWATKKVSSLDSAIQKEFMEENASFVANYLAQDSINDLVFLGNESWKKLKKQLKLKFEVLKSEKGPCAATFDFGRVKIGSTYKRYFFTSKGPSVQFTQNSEKKEIHAAFGRFMRELRMSS